jgi:hypothetical protein
MHESVQRLPAAVPAGPREGFVVVSDAVWCVTIVDATLVRYHAEVYDRAVAERAAPGGS